MKKEMVDNLIEGKKTQKITNGTALSLSMILFFYNAQPLNFKKTKTKWAHTKPIHLNLNA
jgi:hypothetical protein